jgi:single-stranded DNA-specific DHH superfamily exonuclease
MEFKNLSLIEIDELIRSGKTTSQEVYEYFLARTKQYNPELNAFNTLPEEFSIVCSRHPELAKDPGNQKPGFFVPQNDETIRKINETLTRYTDLASLGTVADCMPLIGENRVITTLGLRQMKNSSSAGLRKFIE